MEIRDLKELVTLMKLLKFVKFESSDFELSFFAGSPILSEIFRKISEEVQNHNFKNDEKGKGLDWGYIENENTYVGMIKERIKKIPGWDTTNISQKIELIKVFIYPYKYNDSTINELCNS